MMNGAHDLIFIGGVLGLLSIFAGLLSRRLGAPLLVVFLALGMLAGEDGPGGIIFDDFSAAYLIGSVALAVILFEGGLKTNAAMLNEAFWPAFILATFGVAITATVIGLAVHWIAGLPTAVGMLLGAVIAPTDAAAVASLLRRARLAVPERVMSLLEVESGLNDPMSVFLTILVLRILARASHLTASHAVLLFGEEMLGGAVIGLAGGWLLQRLLARLRLEAALAAILALAAALTLFGGAQRIDASGFLAIYIAGVMVGMGRHATRVEIEHFFESLAWLSQIVLFLMLGLLVTPHELAPLILRALALAAVLIFVARPIATFACLVPFRFRVREMTFASWVGLRGAVPIYLTIIPVIGDPARGGVLFGVVFVLVIASLLVQGWTIPLVAKLLGFGQPATAGLVADD
jgi:NhaP-type Na+/H+ and K+/H+ antiporter